MDIPPIYVAILLVFLSAALVFIRAKMADESGEDLDSE